MEFRWVVVIRGSSKPLLVLEISRAALAEGEVVPMPTEPVVVIVPEVFTLFTELLPSCMLLLADTTAPYPMAVALVKLFAEASAP